MTVTDAELDLRIRTFKASSSFTPGDAFSFKINFNDEAYLPGKFDPAAYLQQLGVDLIDKNVLVVCPGNGGLCVEAIKSGASTVVALEPRNVYHRALPTISGFASDIIGTTFSQKSDAGELVEAFDIVLWPEGLEDVPHPKTLLQKVLGAMKKGGRLFMEVGHGSQGQLVESINSWRPTAEAFKESLSALGDLEFVSELQGRNQTRTIYTIVNNTLRVEVHPGKDFQSVKDIEEFADKLKAHTHKTSEAIGQAAVAETVEEKVEALDTAVNELAEKAGALKEAGLTPTPILSDKAKELASKVASVMNDTPGELDSIYEGRASTPKSNDKKKTKAPRSKKTKPKS
jgi:hypothetical protein